MSNGVRRFIWTREKKKKKEKRCFVLFRFSWGLVNQTPGYLIEFQTMKYDKQLHERFHTSNNQSEMIIEYIWPCLIDGADRICVAKGVVITEDR